MGTAWPTSQKCFWASQPVHRDRPRKRPLGPSGSLFGPSASLLGRRPAFLGRRPTFLGRPKVGPLGCPKALLGCRPAGWSNRQAGPQDLRRTRTLRSAFCNLDCVLHCVLRSRCVLTAFSEHCVLAAFYCVLAAFYCVLTAFYIGHCVLDCVLIPSNAAAFCRTQLRSRLRSGSGICVLKRSKTQNTAFSCI